MQHNLPEGGQRMDDKVLKALGEPNRYKLMCLMAERSYCVGALARVSGLSESSVSQHIKVLREADLVYGVRRGFYTHYAVNRETLSKVIESLSKILTTHRKPCDGPFYGCPESEAIRCGAYVPPEKR